MPGIKRHALCLALAVSSVVGGTLADEGIAAFREGRYSVAFNKLKQASEQNPKDERTQLFLALTLAAQNKCEMAGPSLLLFSESKDDELARMDGLALAKCAERLNKPVGALAALDKLERRFPNDADVTYALAKFHMRAFNNATLAMFERSASSYRVHQLSAEIFEVQGRYDAAADEYRKAIALQPNAPDLQYRLGRAILMKSHDPAALEEALRAFEAERKVNPEDAATEFQLGQIAQVQNRSDAAAHFERALQLSPDFTEALIALAKVDASAKRYDSAIARLKRVVAIQPSNEGAHYALMMAYRDSGRMNEAKTEKTVLDKLQRPPEGEFTQFLKKLGEKPPQP